MKALSHAQVRLLIERAADGLLTAFEQRGLESHLHGCAECRAYAAEFAALEASLGKAMNERWGQPNLGKASETKLVKTLQQQFPPSDGSLPPKGGAGSIPWWPIALTVAALALIGGLATPGIINRIADWNFGNAAGITKTVTPTPVTPTGVTPTQSSTPVTPTGVTPTQSSTSSPLVLIAIPNRNANCREGNGNAFDIADTLYEGIEYTPIGRGRDNLWVQFWGPINQTKCWAYIENIDLLINGLITPIEDVPESLLPFVSYPPTLTPTFTPSPELPEPSDTPTPAAARQPQCNDGVDNDQDGAIDYPRDKDCKDAKDNNEFD